VALHTSGIKQEPVVFTVGLSNSPIFKRSQKK